MAVLRNLLLFPATKNNYASAIIKACLAIGLLLYLVYIDYQLLHVTMEMTVILVSFCVFVLTLNTLHLSNNPFYATIGIGYGFSAFFMLVHLLISIGGDIIPGLSRNSAVQFGLLARVMQTGIVLYAVLARETLDKVGRTIKFLFVASVLMTIAVVYMQPLPILLSEKSFTGFAKLCYAMLAGVCIINFCMINREKFKVPKDIRDNLLIVHILNTIAFLLFVLSVRRGDWASSGTVVLSSVSCYFFYCAMIKPVLMQPIETLCQSIIFKEEKLRKQEEEIARLNRLDVAGQMAASIGHEIRNPMTTVRGYLQLFQRRENFAQYRDDIGVMIEELDRANSIITEFLTLAKNKAVEMQRNNLNTVISTLFPLMQAESLCIGHQLQLDLGDIPDNDFDEKEIRQLILNLFRNGLEAMESRGVITIRTYLREGQIVLAVQDTGSGIPKEILNMLGTPFVTTKNNGTGLGLPVCYRVANRHGARIEVDTSEKGTTFNILFYITVL